MIFRDAMQDWQDFDIAAYLLGCSIGVFTPTEDPYQEFRRVKGTVYTGHGPLGTALHRMLEELEQAGVLEYGDGGRFRWVQGAADNSSNRDDGKQVT